MAVYRKAFVMFAVAGCACSAMAQQRDVQAPAAKGVRTRAVAAQTAKQVVELEPIAVRVNGQWVPFTTGGADANVVAYDNIVGSTGFYTVPIPPANTALPQYALDDITLASGGPQRITGVRPAFATGDVVANPTAQMGVAITWFNGLDPQATPVNSSPNLGVLVVFAPPASGWAANTIYTGTQFIFFPDGPTMSGSGAIEVALTDSTGGFLNPDFTPAWSSLPSVGSSSDTAWIDQDGDQAYAAGEAVMPTGGGLPLNIRIALATEAVSTSPTGSCCLADGACILATESQCLGLGGVYGGNGTVCAGDCPTAPVLWNNGPLATGASSMSGTFAPAGTQWSEVPAEGTCTLNVAGFGGTGSFRLADDFVIPAGESWDINSITVYGYATGGSTVSSPWTGITMRIFQGHPDNGVVVFGDTVTNLLTNPSTQASFANIYRIFNTLGNAANATANRPVWQFEVPVNVTLPAGHYYVDFNYTGSGFVPPVSPMANGFGVTAIEGANALQFQAAANRYLSMGSAGAAAIAGVTGCLAAINELPFVIRGTSSGGSSCYANCDGSTNVPFLNVNDFICFQSAFAAGDPYANCDGSTNTPILNVNDFICFQSAFAAGCSAP